LQQSKEAKQRLATKTQKGNEKRAAKIKQQGRDETKRTLDVLPFFFFPFFSSIVAVDTVMG
jgi:hypothetical protein